jgi:peptide/nickel transport system permease protein
MTTTTKVATIQETSGRRPYSYWRDVWQRLWRSPSARLGMFISVIIVTLAITIPIIDNAFDATKNSPRDRFNPPDCIIGTIVTGLQSETCVAPFGTDKNGRDVMRRVGHGMVVSLYAGFVSVAISLTFGTAIGLFSGYLSGWVDSVLMRTMDVILAFPSLLLAIAIVAVAGRSLTNGMIAVAITAIPVYARLARSMAISIRNSEFVTAARSTGASDFTIIRNHILPNSLAPLIVQTTLSLGTAVVETAALGYLGLGQQAPYPELGKMLADSQEVLISGKWWVMLFPAITIILMVLGFNLFGDGLRDALDPRLRGND